MKEQLYKPFSIRRLSIIFIFACIIFILIRWDSSSWISHKVQQTASQAGIHLAYQDLSVSGLGIMLTDVVIQQPGKQPVILDEIKVSASLSALTSGKLAANIEAFWLGNPISASLSQDGNLLHITNIDAMVDVSRVEGLKIPAKLSGVIHATGELTLDQNTGLPQSGAIHTTWNQAMAGLATPEFTLGDYIIDINSVEDTTQPWQWKIAGGSGVGLNGSGTVFPRSPDPKQWVISGLIEANIDGSNPSLSMMMQSMLGSTRAKLRISGSLGIPRTDIIR